MLKTKKIVSLFLTVAILIGVGNFGTTQAQAFVINPYTVTNVVETGTMLYEATTNLIDLINTYYSEFDNIYQTKRETIQGLLNQIRPIAERCRERGIVTTEEARKLVNLKHLAMSHRNEVTDMGILGKHYFFSARHRDMLNQIYILCDNLLFAQPSKDVVITIRHNKTWKLVSTGLDNDVRQAYVWNDEQYVNTDQKFLLHPLGNGYFTLISQFSGYTLDARDGTNRKYENGVQVDQYPRTDDENQQWKLKYTGNGLYAIMNLATDRCLDVPTDSDWDGAILQLWDYHGGSEQQFIIEF